MQSIIALAGVVGFAAAAVAPPAYGAVSSEAAAATVPAYAVSTQAAAATVPAYKVSSEEAAATVPAYKVSSSEAAATVPAYKVSTEEAKATAPVYHTSWEAVTETIKTSQYVTVCPSPTAPATLVFNTKTFIVTEATTITVSACKDGCTITKTVPVTEPAKPTTAVVVKPSTEVKPVPLPSPIATEEVKTIIPVYTQPASAAVPTTTLLAYKSQNATGSYPTAPAKYTGAASKVGAGAFAMVAGLAAFL
jgi:hypothetical protein